jgi:hypothetical protein
MRQSPSACGRNALTIKDPKDLGSALAQARDAEDLTLLDVIADPGEIQSRHVGCA